MGVELWGVDIAGIIFENTDGQLEEMTLIKRTVGAVDPNDIGGPGTGMVTTNYPCQGIIDDRNLRGDGVTYRPNDNATRHQRRVTIIGDSLPAGIVPMGDPAGTAGDRITVAGITYTITGVKSDPARATYTCAVLA